MLGTDVLGTGDK